MNKMIDRPTQPIRHFFREGARDNSQIFIPSERVLKRNLEKKSVAMMAVIIVNVVEFLKKRNGRHQRLKILRGNPLIFSRFSDKRQRLSPVWSACVQ